MPDLPLDVRDGFDTDGDGRGDTVLTTDGPDLLVHTDLDGDGLADRVLRIGADATITVEPPDGSGTAAGLWCPADPGFAD